MLNVETIPNLETILRLAAKWGTSMSGKKATYPIVLRGIGTRLFKEKSAETIAHEKAMSEEWITTLDAETRERVRESMEEDEKDGISDIEPWLDGKEANEEFDHADFKLTSIWKKYTAHMKEIPTVPMMGGSDWDLRTWTDQEKAPFLFSKMD